MTIDRRREIKRLSARRRSHVQRAWNEQNPERVRAAKRAYYEKNRVAVIARSAAWAKANPDKMKAAIKAWAERNPGKLREYCNNRYARLTGAPGKLTAEDFAAIVAVQGGCCFDCGKERKLTIGHLVPITKGGSNWPSNIAAQCQPCNSRQRNNVHPSVKEAA